MSEKKDIEIFSGKVILKELSDPVYRWPDGDSDDCNLVFKKAYIIEHTDWDAGIVECSYRVHDRKFLDLSCMRGDTLHDFPDGYEIRKHEDGTRFLFSYVGIPTFDFEDREWDSVSHIAVYCDEGGINLIHCRHGYKISRISVYIGLIKSVPSFTEWLKILRCNIN